MMTGVTSYQMEGAKGGGGGVVIPFILDIRLMDLPAGVTHRMKLTQDFSTFFLRCLP